MRETLGEIAGKWGDSLKLVSVRKKVRGMRRKRRKLNSWSAYYKELDISALLKYNKVYVKVWISPFYNLFKYSDRKIGKKNPPHRFRKQVLHELIDIYLAWDDQLKRLNEPYYLMIWIGDPDFMDSQVVAAVKTEIDYYSNLFEMDPTFKPFPYKGVHSHFNKFEWQRCVHGYYVWEDDLESLEEVNEFSKKAFRVNDHLVNGQNQKSFFIRTGDIWLGHNRRSGNFT